ncbi:MAG: cytochrome b562 [Bordetella sp.]|uniref:cytochrome b562 n=1 Tax=Bordetella sp. TaxID=28081 RepID=UPI003F7BE40C
MIKFRLLSAVRAIACAGLLAAAPLAHAGEIRNLMRDMNQAMSGAMSSTTMPQLTRYVSRLERDAQQASQQHYGYDQGTYNQGMKALRQDLSKVDQAIKAGDMAAAKRELQQVIRTRNHYHHLLS